MGVTVVTTLLLIIFGLAIVAGGTKKDSSPSIKIAGLVINLLCVAGILYLAAN